MRVWRGLESIRQPFAASTVAIGMFDGLHVGHRALIEAACQDARACGRPLAVFTFDRHPAELLAPDRVPGYLTTPAQRLALFEAWGVDDLVIARFDERLRQLSPEAFLRFVVVGVLGARAVFVGFDFRFGRDQAGDASTLREAADRLGFAVHVLDPVLVDGEKASSSRIRQLLRAGELRAALRVLGHPYLLEGIVVEGLRLGRKLGFPTANLQLERAQVVPADGIYAVWAEVEGTRWKGACSIGVRPTLGGTDRAIEAHLIGCNQDLYGQRITLDFVERIRDQRKFQSLEALAEQIGRDLEQAERVLGVPG